jgi:ABC-2 type transport system ATP-binding protein
VPVIEVEGLSKRYGGTVAVDDVSFTVEEGEIFGVLGPNGAGKTTAVECVEGLRRPDAGRIRVLGLDPQRDAARLRQVLGAQLQRSALPDNLQVGEALALYRSFYARGADPDRLLDELGLAESLRTRFGALSGGQAQRLSIALALVGDPRVAVLDELTTGLDPRSRRETWGLVEGVRDRGVTVVLVTHLMEEAERLCDRIAVIDRGRVVALDTPAGLVARAGGGQRVRFRTAAPLDPDVLLDLDDVDDVTVDDDRVVVSGRGDDLVHTVTVALVGAGVVPVGTEVVRPSLDDAFLALTGRAVDAAHDTADDEEEVVR